MRAFMKSLVLTAALTMPLTACMGQDPAPADPIPTSTTTDRAAQAQAMQKAGVGTVEGTTTNPSVLTKPVHLDTSKQLESREVWVITGDPQSERQLLPYLSAVGVTLPGMSSSWMIDKVEIISDRLRHYRFRRFVSAEGKGPPELDILTPKQP
jgi:hypothetical protein